jgi:hypothetical protein
MSDDLVKRLERAGEYEPLGHVGWEASDRIKAQAVLIKELTAALEQVEAWWLREGMNHHLGAPYAIFAARSALAKAVFALKSMA